MTHSRTNYQIRHRLDKLYSLDRTISVNGGSAKPGDRVKVNGRLGTFLVFYKLEKKLKVELDEPLGTLRLCSPNEVQLAE
jgi:hypothetical protein